MWIIYNVLCNLGGLLQFLHYACALPKARESILREQNHVSQQRKSRKRKNKIVALKNFLVFQVGFRGVLTVARLCLGLITEKNVLSNDCRSLTALKPLQTCDFAPNV